MHLVAHPDKDSASSVPSAHPSFIQRQDPVKNNAAASSGSHAMDRSIVKGGYSKDRKFNVVVYGVDECPRSTSISSRLDMDLDKAVSVFSVLDQSISSHSIKDMFRLGRFSTERKQP